MSAKPYRRIGFWTFIAFMLALTALFVGLGVWQLERLREKEALIAAVESKQHLPPLTLPPSAEWVGLDTEVYTYRPLTVTGRYLTDASVLVFTSLSEPRGKFGGPGYWVMTPLVRDDGGVIYVNRGFVPQASAPNFIQSDPAGGPQTVTGLALPAEAAGPFTPGPDAIHRIDWVRDPARLAKSAPEPLQPMAGFYVEAPAGAPGALPQGGETVVEFPNNHFGYALTWFGFAILTPGLLSLWIWRQLRPRPEDNLGAVPNKP